MRLKINNREHHSKYSKGKRQYTTTVSRSLNFMISRWHLGHISINAVWCCFHISRKKQLLWAFIRWLCWGLQSHWAQLTLEPDVHVTSSNALLRGTIGLLLSWQMNMPPCMHSGRSLLAPNLWCLVNHKGQVLLPSIYSYLPFDRRPGWQPRPTASTPILDIQRKRKETQEFGHTCTADTSMHSHWTPG